MQLRSVACVSDAIAVDIVVVVVAIILLMMIRLKGGFDRQVGGVGGVSALQGGAADERRKYVRWCDHAFYHLIGR
jgi:hypothetical protein